MTKKQKSKPDPPIIPVAPRVKAKNGPELVLFGGVPTIKAKKADPDAGVGVDTQ